jgi:hypothetical protein
MKHARGNIVFLAGQLRQSSYIYALTRKSQVLFSFDAPTHDMMQNSGGI